MSTRKKFHRVIALLTRDEIDFLDKLGKDALFSTGTKLSRTKIIRTLVEILQSLSINGKDISGKEELKEEILRVLERRRSEMMRRMAILMVAALILGMVVPVYAAGPFDKLGRGIVNAATGFLEIPKNIYEVSEEHDPVTGLIWGSIKGSGMAVGRTSVGTCEAVTFPLPEYETILEPEYVF